MINVVNLTHRYGVKPVLKDVNLTINRGELIAILGPNGMGKTTLLSCIAGVLSPQKGHVEIDGFRRRGSVEDEMAIRERVIYVTDHPWLPVNRTGREFIYGVGQLYDVADESLFEHTERLLDLFDLTPQADQTIKNYSNGQKHKIALCAALICETPILLLDEVFSGGLDPSGIMAMKKVLRHLVEKKGCTAVITSPVPELVEEVADRFIILREGRVIAFDTLEGLRKLTDCTGPLSEVLQKLIHPQVLEKLQRYFEVE